MHLIPLKNFSTHVFVKHPTTHLNILALTLPSSFKQIIINTAKLVTVFKMGLNGDVKEYH